MKSKRLISGLLALTFVFGGAVVPSNVVNNISIISASAGNQFISEQFYCTELDNGTVRIDSAKSDWCNLETAAVIPSEIDGKTVTSIASSAFNNCKFTSVEIPNTITKIAYNSFYGCKKLRSIVLPGSIEIIDGCAFQYCTSLESVTLNEGLGLIREYAFDNCKSLKSIEIPSSVRCIGDNAFNNCTNLAEIHISKGTQSLEIGKNAFCNCQSLTNVKIPSSVTRIDNCAFKNCTLLNFISLPDSLEFLGEYEVFNNCSSLMDVNIPTSLKEIPSSTFSGCTRLTNITIPDNIKEIGSAAFSGCTGLTNITIPNNIEKIGYAAFCDCTGLKRIWIPASVKSIGSDAFTYYDNNKNEHYPLKNLTIYCYPNTAAEMYAKANGLNYKFLGSPKNIKYTYSQAYHQLQFTWDKVKGADRYSIAVYQAGKWVIQKDNITTNSFVTPKNLTPGKTYKVAIAARVDGIWDKENAINNAVTVTIPADALDKDKDGYDDIYEPEPEMDDYSFLNGEILGIAMYPYDVYNLLPIEATSESSVKTSDKIKYVEEQYFRFKWCNNGYKIYSVKYENNNKVLTINQSGDVVLEEDKNLLSQIWEVLPYGTDGDGLCFRSKLCYTLDCKPVSYFLSYKDSKLKVSTNKDLDINKVRIYSPAKWIRFGEMYLNYIGWENTMVVPEKTIANYHYNVRKQIDPNSNIHNYMGHDLLVNQSGGGFPAMNFHDSPMNEVCCEIMGTYNALVLHGEPVDFYKLAAEFEINATSDAPSGDNGWAGSNPYKIGNCLDAYNVEYTTINNNLNLNDTIETIITVDDYSDVDSTNKASCDEFDKELKNGVCGIISYKYATDCEGYLPFELKLPVEAYLAIHTYATVYNSYSASPISTFNLLCGAEPKEYPIEFSSTYEALKNYDKYNNLKNIDLYLVGYVLK